MASKPVLRYYRWKVKRRMLNELADAGFALKGWDEILNPVVEQMAVLWTRTAKYRWADRLRVKVRRKGMPITGYHTDEIEPTTLWTTMDIVRAHPAIRGAHDLEGGVVGVVVQKGWSRSVRDVLKDRLPLGVKLEIAEL